LRCDCENYGWWPKPLKVGEHGLKLKGQGGLGEWLGPIEEAQGRTEEALAAWLAVFQRNHH